MNREIKFRGKCLISNEWKFGSLIDASPKGKYIVRYNKETDDSDSFPVHSKTVGQFSGQKDKNGIEIYEGDVVEYDNGTKAEVIFKEGTFCGYDGYAVCSSEAYTLLSLEDMPFNGGFEVEVIGNVHEKALAKNG